MHIGRNYRAILLAGAASISLASIAAATDYNYPNPPNNTTPFTLQTGDTLTVASGSSLGTLTTWALNHAGTTPVVINNSGTMSNSGSRALVTSGTASGAQSITINNLTSSSVITSSSNDAFQISSSVGAGTVTINNAGTISTTGAGNGGQALDFNSFGTTGTLVIANSGTIQSSGDDAIRSGGNSVSITNSGSILALASGKRAIDLNTPSSTETYVLKNSSSSALIKSDDDAIHFGGDIGTGSLTFTNAGTIQSASGQAFDLNSIGTNGTVSITSSGTITSTANDAIRLSGKVITVVNTGSILATASGKRALDLAPTTINSNLVYNLTNGSASNSSALIQSDDDAVRIGSSSTTLSATAPYVATVDNFGTIKSAVGQAIDFDKANSTAGKITITNEATGSMFAADADTIRPGANATVNNYGSISNGWQPHAAVPPSTPAVTNGNNSGNDAIDFQSNAGGVVNNFAGGTITGVKNGVTAKYAPTITNAGTITGLDGSGINIDTSRDATPANPDITATGIVTVVNTGTIIGNAVSADGDAIDVDYLTNITNSGTIKAVGKVDPSVGSLNEALAIGGGNVVNNAGGLIISDERAITVDDSNKGNAFGAISIDNAGTITGSNGQAINITSILSNTLTNRATGVINGSVVMGSGNDTVNLYAGQTLNGTLDGGAGTDTINLLGSGNGALGATSNFETLSVQGGAWALSGAQSYSAITVASGSSINLADSAVLGGGATVAGGISGTGKTGNLTIASGGTLTPGAAASIGTLTVNGNLTLTSGSTTQVAVSPTAASLVNVSGTASLNGAFVASLAGGTYAPGQQYTVLTAAGGVSGSYASLSTAAASYLKPRLSYDATHVFLVLDQIQLGSNLGSGASGNQSAVSGAIDNAVKNGSVPTGGFNNLFGLSGSALQGALDQISGQGAPNVSGAVGQSFLGFMGMTAGGGSGAPGDSNVAGGSFAPGLAYDGADAPHRAQLVTGGARVWGGAYGGHVGISGNAGSGAGGLSSNNVGFIGGADAQLGDGLLAGVTFSIGRQTFRSGNATGDSSDQMIGVYARDELGAAYLSVAAGYGWHQIKTLRLVTVAGADVLQGKQNADDYGGRIEGGWRVSLDDQGSSLAPYAAYAAERFESPAYAETAISGASTFALGYAANASTLSRSEFGLRLGKTADRGDALIKADLHAAWAHQYDDQPFSQASFLGLGNASFRVAGVRAAADSALVGAGLEMQGTNGMYVAVHGETQLGDGTTVVEGMGNLGWRW